MCLLPTFEGLEDAWTACAPRVEAVDSRRGCSAGMAGDENVCLSDFWGVEALDSLRSGDGVVMVSALCRRRLVGNTRSHAAARESSPTVLLLLVGNTSEPSCDSVKSFRSRSHTRKCWSVTEPMSSTFCVVAEGWS